MAGYRWFFDIRIAARRLKNMASESSECAGYVTLSFGFEPLRQTMQKAM